MTTAAPAHTAVSHPISDLDPALFANHRVRARGGEYRPFDPERIARAIAKAILASDGGEVLAQRRRDLCTILSRQICETLRTRRPEGGTFDVEEVQDQAELALMRAGEHDAARRFVLYREGRKQARAKGELPSEPAVTDQPAITVRAADGSSAPLDLDRLRRVIDEAASGLEGVSAALLLKDTISNAYDGITDAELAQALVLSARMRIEEEPNYTFAAARLALDQVRTAAVGKPCTQAELQAQWSQYFAWYIRTGIDHGLLSKDLATFDIERLAKACRLDRDNLFQFQGLQILADRYFLHVDDRRIELPQAFWMRVAMGLAAREVNREEVAISFYEMLSTHRYVASTPTLFNSGCVNQQLSSCFLTTIGDDLGEIFSAMRDDALLSKFSGGLGNDWTPVRALGAHIKGTNGKSQGVIPFMKIANDTAVAVNQGGKRKGAICGYLETWHLDIEEFLELRKNTGDDRRRCHDMNTANWVPDLFMERVESDGDWTLFSPNETPDLHDLYGDAFRARYEHYEAEAKAGKLRTTKTLKASTIWRKMLTMLFETGHPWITFKDPCNLRSPQQHAGVVHSSNLCTEITLNTSHDEIAVCNLGSINLPAHTTADGFDHDLLSETIAVAMRMLDNVIDINLYTVPQARRSNLRHRPVGLGVMGFQDALYIRGYAYASQEAVDFADESMEAISYYAILGSSKLAKERGKYASYEGSLWSKGILPLDSINNLAEQRRSPLQQDRSARMDWTPVREHIAKFGMRNSNCLAIAPTATISNIVGLTQSIEPQYQNLFVKSNMSGDFTVINLHLVAELKKRGLWDRQMADDLKYYDGSMLPIGRVPEDLKRLYATAFEVEPHWLIECASRRQKWIDQAQSLNLYMKEPSGKKLDAMYRHAWKTGCKTTYYLRSLGATHVEKSTGRSGGQLNAVPMAPSAAPQSGGPEVRKSGSPAGGAPAGGLTPPVGKACSITDPECEACQ